MHCSHQWARAAAALHRTDVQTNRLQITPDKTIVEIDFSIKGCVNNVGNRPYLCPAEIHLDGELIRQEMSFVRGSRTVTDHYVISGKTELSNCQVLQSRVNSLKSNKVAVPSAELRDYSVDVKFSDRELDLVELAVYGNIRKEFMECRTESLRSREPRPCPFNNYMCDQMLVRCSDPSRPTESARRRRGASPTPAASAAASASGDADF